MLRANCSILGETWRCAGRALLEEMEGRSMGSSLFTGAHQVLVPTVVLLLWWSQWSTEGVLPGLPAGSCGQSPSATALPVLRNVILSMKMQHDVLVSYNPLNPSQASALWGFRCK